MDAWRVDGDPASDADGSVKLPWIEDVAQGVAEHIEGQHGDDDRDAGEEHDPPVAGEERHARRRRSIPNSPCGSRAPMPRYERPASSAITLPIASVRRHDHGRRDVRQQMTPENARVGRAQRSRRVDVVEPSRRERFGAHEARHAEPARRADQEDESADAARDSRAPARR